MSFKIVAVQPLECCDDSIIKNLTVNVVYFLDNNYYINSQGKIISKQKDELLPKHFFYQKRRSTSLETINIQAIVGKNGKGKSSLVELIIRILNNFFRQYKIGKVTDDLIFAKGVHANLFLDINDKLCRIFIDSRTIKNDQDDLSIDAVFFEGEKIIYKSTNQNNSKVYRKELIEISHLFFTMYINYSLYGLDDRDYVKENLYLKSVEENYDDLLIVKESWLTKLFHKNDGYQTPIVLHPFREEGQINVRNEKFLVSQRLLSLIIEEVDNDFHLTEDLIADNISLVFRKKDALDNFLDETITSSFTEDSQYYKVDKRLFSDRKRGSESETLMLVDNFYNFLKRNEILLKKFQKIIRNKKVRKFAPKDLTSYSDMTLIILAKFNRLLDNSHSITEFNYQQIYHDLVSKVNKSETTEKIEYIINETSDFNFLTYNLFQVFSVYYEFWIKYFHLEDKAKQVLVKNEFIFEKTLFYYCLSKSFKTITYPKYRDYNRIDTIEYFSANLSLNEKITTSSIQEYLEKIIDKDNTHVSLKLRQSIKILELSLQKAKSNLINFYKECINGRNVDVKTLHTYINEAYEEEARSNKSTDRLLFLPPRNFDTTILLKSLNTKKNKIDINNLSSGEYQKNSTISSILYHLKNIDSVNYEKESKAKFLSGIKIYPTYAFKNINIMLDEIELYFHPEFQRNFVNDLINAISKVEFKNITDLNFTFITHSPFILSDIPQDNILFLDDFAKPAKLLESFKTFGTNIHDMLHHSFFLENGAIGAFALEKIDEIIDQLNNKKVKLTFEETNHLFRNISLIGEPFLKNKLLEMYYARFEKQKRIDALEAELKNLKTDD